MKDVIKETQNVLSNGGNVIKTRDDRELILVDKDGNIQNAYLYITTSQHLTYKKVEKRSGIFDN